MPGVSPGQASILNNLIRETANLLVEGNLLSDNKESDMIKEYLANVEVDDLDPEYLDQLTQNLFDANIRERMLKCQAKDND